MVNIFKGLAATMLLVASTANAGLITLSDSFGTQGATDDLALSGNFSQILTIAQFDTMGGTRTLTNVLIAVESQIDLVGSSVNASPENALGYASVGFSIFSPWHVEAVGAANEFIFEPNNSSIPLFEAASDLGGAQTLAVGDALEYDYSTNLRTGTMTGVSLAAFLAGDVDFDFSILAFTQFSNSNSSGSSVWTNTNNSGIYSRVDVTYTYTDALVTVSEPGPLALLGASILSLSMIRRKTIRTAK
jgi:hypothetical protein